MSDVSLCLWQTTHLLITQFINIQGVKYPGDYTGELMEMICYVYHIIFCYWTECIYHCFPSKFYLHDNTDVGHARCRGHELINRTNAQYQHTNCSQSCDQTEILVLIVVTEAVDGADSWISISCSEAIRYVVPSTLPWFPCVSVSCRYQYYIDVMFCVH